MPDRSKGRGQTKSGALDLKVGMLGALKPYAIKYSMLQKPKPV